MLVDVETFLLYSLVNTYTYTLIYYLEDNVGNYNAVDDAYHGGYNLNPKLMPVAIEGTMHTKGIESIIILELLLYYRYHEEADDGGNDTDAEGTHCGWLLVDNPVDEHPGGGCCRKPPPHTQCAIGR